jgi:hypothetical protein
VSGGTTVNACENYFSILKRGINGVYQHVSPTHLKRYVGEFGFRYNNRIGLGIDDMARTEKVAKWRGRQAVNLPKNSSAARSRSVLTARLGGAASPAFPRQIRDNFLSDSMSRRSGDYLLECFARTAPTSLDAARSLPLPVWWCSSVSYRPCAQPSMN